MRKPSPKRIDQFAVPVPRDVLLWCSLNAPSSWDPLIQAGLRSAILRCNRLVEAKGTGHDWAPETCAVDDDGLEVDDWEPPSPGMVRWACRLCGAGLEVAAGVSRRTVTTRLNKAHGTDCEAGGRRGETVLRECGGLGHWRAAAPGERVELAPRPDMAGEGEADGSVPVWRTISDVWECSRCGHTTRNPKIGAVGSMADCSWRGKGRLSSSDHNAVEDSLIDFCDARRRLSYRDNPRPWREREHDATQGAQARRSTARPDA